MLLLSEYVRMRTPDSRDALTRCGSSWRGRLQPGWSQWLARALRLHKWLSPSAYNPRERQQKAIRRSTSPRRPVVAGGLQVRERLGDERPGFRSRAHSVRSDAPKPSTCLDIECVERRTARSRVLSIAVVYVHVRERERQTNKHGEASTARESRRTDAQQRVFESARPACLPAFHDGRGLLYIHAQ